MSKIVIYYKDYIHCTVKGLFPDDIQKLVKHFQVFIPSARYSNAYRMGIWKGNINYFQLTGNTFVAFIPEILDNINLERYDGVEYIVNENMKEMPNLSADIDENYMSDIKWEKGHRLEGQPMILEDHQVRAANALLSHPQGIISSATGSGKCVCYETNLYIYNNKKYLYKNKEMNIQIGQLYDAVCKYYNINGEYEKEIDVKDLGIKIDSPNGLTNINYVIKKKTSGLKIIFENNIELICAKRHILYTNNQDCFACDLRENDYIDSKNGLLQVKKIENTEVVDYYDINVDYPNIYYDANGIKHHNTCLSATLFRKVKPYGRSVIIVPSKDLATQSARDYRNWGFDVGIVGCGLREFGHDITVCTWQTINSLEKRKKEDSHLTAEELEKLKENVVCLIFDETHLASGTQVQKILEQTFKNVPIRWGLTGTIPKEKSQRMCIESVLGRVIDEKITAKELQDKGFLSSCKINCIRLKDNTKCMDYQSEVDYLCSNDDRLNFMANLISQITLQNNNTLVLVSRINIGEILEDKIAKNNVDAIFLNGSVKSKKRFEEYESIKVQNNRCLICTDKIASTGLNIPRLYNIIFIDFGKSFQKTIQSIGRGLRKAADKDHVDIYDISSTMKYSKKHFNERIKYYEESQYPYNIIEIDKWK